MKLHPDTRLIIEKAKDIVMNFSAIKLEIEETPNDIETEVIIDLIPENIDMCSLSFGLIEGKIEGFGLALLSRLAKQTGTANRPKREEDGYTLMREQTISQEEMKTIIDAVAKGKVKLSIAIFSGYICASWGKLEIDNPEIKVWGTGVKCLSKLLGKLGLLQVREVKFAPWWDVGVGPRKQK